MPCRMGIHKLDNVVMTGDRAAFNAETLENFLRVGMQNVDKLARGKTPEHIVDLDLSMQAANNSVTSGHLRGVPQVTFRIAFIYHRTASPLHWGRMSASG